MGINVPSRADEIKGSNDLSTGGKDPSIANIDNVDQVKNHASNLELLASAALQNQESYLGMAKEEFLAALGNIPQETEAGIYNKAAQLVANKGSIVAAPLGGEPSSMLVSSARLKDAPHLIKKGKATGQLLCDSKCPQWNGAKICSHVVAVAEKQEVLRLLVDWYAKTHGKKGVNITKVVQTDMPTNPGKKPNEQAKKMATSRPTIVERVSRINTEPPTHPFTVKEINSRIQKCQGCKGQLKSSGVIPAPPFNFCVARKERRPFYDKDGKRRVPGRATDAHYHLRMSCIIAEEPSFQGGFFVVPE